jgi:fumarate reductase subunit D
VTFTTPAVLHSLSRQPALTVLTAVAFPVGVAICAASWRSLFGFQRESITALFLLVAAIIWLLRGTIESTEVATLMLVLSGWAYRRRAPQPQRTPR